VRDDRQLLSFKDYFHAFRSKRTSHPFLFPNIGERLKPPTRSPHVPEWLMRVRRTPHY
jgi:hypothetical protein